MQTTLDVKRLTFVLCSLVALCIVLIPAAQARLIDGDEGFYLMAARLVSEGRRLYADFFFPQMPLVPEVYGGWFALVGPGWRTGRLLASLWAVGAGLVLVLEVRRRTGSWRWGTVALGLYLFSGFVLGWFTTAKTYGLAALLLLGGVAALARPGLRAAFFGGLLLALAIGTRLYLVVALPCACLYLFREGGARRARRLLAFGAGVLAAILPLLPVLIRDAQAFYFGNVVFHALRDTRAMGLWQQLQQKGLVLATVLSIYRESRVPSVQFPGLLLAAVAAALLARTPRNQLSTYLWVALLFTSLVPTPAYGQYFCLLIPFLIMDVVSLAAVLTSARIRPFLIAAGLAYAALGVIEGHRYLRSGVDVPGVVLADRAPRWSIATVQRAAALIDRQGLAQGVTWWPGYFVSTRTSIVPELANDFGMLVAGRLSEPERRRYHLLSHRELSQWLDEQRVPLVVVGNWASRESNDLGERGYRIVGRLENVVVWSLFPPR